MSPVIEGTPNRPFILLIGNEKIEIVVDRICEPNGKGQGKYVLKRDGEVVSTFDGQSVMG